jgi:hypothetical protein
LTAIAAVNTFFSIEEAGPAALFCKSVGFLTEDSGESV